MADLAHDASGPASSEPAAPEEIKANKDVANILLGAPLSA